jgi:hypothetical protein
VKEVLHLMWPSMLAASGTQVAVLLNSIFASFTAGQESSLAWLSIAQRLQQLPLGLFGVAVATVTLPMLSRLATEGITRRNGDLAMSPDEISFLEGFMQGVGLPTNQITDRNALVGAQFKADEFYKSRTTQLKRAYTEAYRSNDTAAMREVREDWQRTQDARRSLGYKAQPLGDLLKAPQEQRKREADTAGGAAFNRGNEGFVRGMAPLYGQ